ncbi:TIGR02678 family protein [Luteolibacter ambystomatis]|uniref:TIGR02678 family protein n=1 Tax=Luteolibacter ambystomatis TaxID=2824561 RepID=A0A975J1C7_9BACT|nr:TIGR02678 family protein [Luteolibacter ambystomatis]QUE52228.1 TIGR02678 family protein [Luteolibacter ambystomatis]
MDDKLGELALAERQHATRCLLQHPMLSAGGAFAEQFGLVRKHAESLREWFAHHANWELQVTSDLARLRKTPPDSSDGTRPARDSRTDAPFTRSRYVLLCLALATLERSERQITLGRLAEEIQGFFKADPELEQAGMIFDLQSVDQRRNLVQIIRFLLEHGALRRIQGEEDAFLKNERSDALYNINRSVLSGMLAVRRGPSMIQNIAFRERLAAIVEEPLPETDDGRNRRLRVRLMRRLLDDPILYYEDLEPDERVYLDSQRVFILRHIHAATGMASEVRKEGIALLDQRGDMTDLGLPEEGTDGHLALLVAEFLANMLRRDESALCGVAVLREHVAQLIEVHRKHWRKDVTEPGADRLLMESTIDRLVALRLVRRTSEAIKPLPAIARFALGNLSKPETAEEESSPQ